MLSSNRVAIVLASVLAAALALWAGTAPANAAREAEAGPAKIATIDTLAVIESLLASERFKPARDAFEAEQRTKLDRNRSEMDAIQTRYAALPDGSDQRAALAEEFGAKRTAEDEMLAEAEKYNTSQVISAYRVTIEASSAVASKLGYTHVLSTRNDPSLIRSDNVPGAIQEILARPVLRSPASDDVTDAVLKELKVSPVPAGQNTTPPPPAPKPER